MPGIPFIKDFTFDYGTAREVTPLVRRVVANNPSPFTFKGTGTYIIGHGKVAIVDPGPDQQDHIEAVIADQLGEPPLGFSRPAAQVARPILDPRDREVLSNDDGGRCSWHHRGLPSPGPWRVLLVDP